MNRINKINHYCTGATIGMCFEYAFRVATAEVFIYPFIIGLLMTASAIHDIIHTKTSTSEG